MCEALDVLHRNGLIHGDVSPGNLIVSGRDLVLTDYDFVGRIDEPIAAPAPRSYCAPSHHAAGRRRLPTTCMRWRPASFHVIFEREPFRHGGAPAKEHGLNWEAVDPEQRAEYPTVLEFLRRATDPDPDQRFPSAAEALKALAGAPPVPPPPVVAPMPVVSPPPEVPPASPAAGPALVPAPSAGEPAPVPEPSAAPTPVPAPTAGGPAPVEPPDAPAVRREQRVEWLRGVVAVVSGVAVGEPGDARARQPLRRADVRRDAPRGGAARRRAGAPRPARRPLRQRRRREDGAAPASRRTVRPRTARVVRAGAGGGDGRRPARADEPRRFGVVAGAVGRRPARRVPGAVSGGAAGGGRRASAGDQRRASAGVDREGRRARAGDRPHAGAVRGPSAGSAGSVDRRLRRRGGRKRRGRRGRGRDRR